MSAVEGQDGLTAALPARARPGGRLWEIDVVGRIWRFFTSVRLALVLILIITAAVMAGTLIDQAPPSVIANDSAWESWLQRAEGKYGTVWTQVFETAQLFNVFHSLWFRALVALLTANIIICTINRWKGIWTTVFHTRVRMGDAFFEHSRFHAGMTAQMSEATAAQRVRKALSRARYRVAMQEDDGAVAIFADKNRFSRFGTFFSHLSIVMILAGTVIGGVWGFKDNEFIIPEGTTRDVGRGTGLSVMLEHFTDEYDPAGPPKDFRSDIVVYKDGAEVKRGTVRVNSPMSVEGVRFYQSFFGQAAVMEVTDESGNLLVSESVPLAWVTRDGDRPIGSFPVPEKGLMAYVIGPRTGETDPLVPAGEMRLEVYTQSTGTLVGAEMLTQGEPKEVGGVNYRFVRETRFTGLTVRKDPGVNLIWIASAFMVVGLVMLFYLPPKRIWAICKRRPDGTTDVRIATTAERDLSQAKEFENLKERVRLALGITGEDSGAAEGGKYV